MVDADDGRLPIRQAGVALDGRSVHLRPAEPTDAPAFAALLTDPTIHAIWQSADPESESRELADRSTDVAVWAIEVAGEVVGLIQAHEETDPRYRHAGVDIVLASRAQDRGYGSDAVRTVARWLIEDRGHHRLTIDPAASNARDPGVSPGRVQAGGPDAALRGRPRRDLARRPPDGPPRR